MATAKRQCLPLIDVPTSAISLCISSMVTFADQVQLVESFFPLLMLDTMHAHIRAHVAGPVYHHLHALFPPAEHNAMVRFGVYGWFLAEQRSNLWRCLGDC